MAFLGLRNVAIVIFYNENRNILLAKRLSKVFYEKYDAPGGKINPNEPVIEGLQREIKEETGILIEKKMFQDELSLVVSDSRCSTQEYLFDKYENGNDYYKLIHEVYICKFPKEEKALCTEPDKHEEWKFYTKNEAMKLDLVPLIRNNFNCIFQGIENQIKNQKYNN